MKKQISIFSMALTLLVGFASCNKDNGSEPSNGEGALKVTLGFTKAPETRASLSTAKPTTSWAKNIKSLKLILVKKSDGKVAVIRDFPYDNTSTGHAAVASPAGGFTGIVSGVYDIHVVANLDQTGNPHAAGTATSQSITVGDLFASKLYQLKTQTPWTTGANGEVVGSVGYDEPAEVFLASKPNITIPNDGSPVDAGVINLARIVSLLRVRIDKSDATNALPVDFTNSQIRLRRIGNSINFAGALQNVNLNNTFSSAKSFKDAAAFTALKNAKDYDDEVMLSDTYTLWNDYLILPGGGATTTTGFNIAISGMAPEGYKLADGTSVPAGGLLVWWQAAVLAAATANGILDVSVKITTPGVGGPGIPIPSEYGKLTVQVDLIEWDAVSGVFIDM